MLWASGLTEAWDMTLHSALGTPATTGGSSMQHLQHPQNWAEAGPGPQGCGSLLKTPVPFDCPLALTDD